MSRLDKLLREFRLTITGKHSENIIYTKAAYDDDDDDDDMHQFHVHS